MLHRESKMFILLFFACLLFMTNCKRQTTFNAREIQTIREKSMEFSQAVIGEYQYWNVYNLLNDSIRNWIDSGLNYFRYYEKDREWLLDSVLCINVRGDRVITSVLRRSMSGESTGDFIDYLYGAKINNSWYFFLGPALVLPREFYQKDIYTPLSFEKLKQIATHEIYRGYLRKNRQGEWEINDNFFNMMFPKNQVAGGFGSCFECETEEEYVLHLVRRNWER